MGTLAALFFFISAVFLFGCALTRALVARARSRASSFERTAYALLASVAVWLIVAWSLALCGRLTRTSLVAAAAGLLVAGVFLLARVRGEKPARATPDWRVLLALTPLAAYALFLLWRGVVAPPHTPDALTYHMPRAALIAQSGHFEYFTETREPRVNHFPANYEMLVATILVLDGSDRLAEWLSTFLFVLFLLETAALSQQWWGARSHHLVVVLFAATMPVLLLQGAALKNDLMVNVFVAGGLLALGRWLDDADWSAALLLGLCTAMAIGTKPQGLVFGALAFIPFAIASARHLRGGASRPKHLAGVAVAVVALLPLLGARAYFLKERAQSVAGAPLTQRVTGVSYGEWSYLYVAPVMMFAAPFSDSDQTVRVPWNGEEWLWARYDPYASNLGALFSVLVLAFPFALWHFRRAAGDLSPRARMLVTAVAFALFIASLPVKVHIYGYISGYPRYLLFITPVVFAWVAGPAATAMMRAVRDRLAWMLIAVVALYVAETLWTYTKRDKFASLYDLRWAAAHPGTRSMPSMPRKSTVVVDEIAADDALIDVHGAPDTWIYTAYGESLRRDLHFIDDASEIRPDAQWVIVERAYSAIWPSFGHMRDWTKHLDQGHATAADLKVIRDLDRDPRFERLFLHERTAQAVYRRKARTIHPVIP